MTSLGQFLLANNRGPFDDLLTRKQLLKRNIDIIIEKRKNDGLEGADILPTLADIEATHVIIPRNAFKPYVPVASQYVKVTDSSGVVEWDSHISFTISHSGDFLWDSFLYINTNAMLATKTTLPPLSEYEPPGQPYKTVPTDERLTGDEAAPFIPRLPEPLKKTGDASAGAPINAASNIKKKSNIPLPPGFQHQKAAPVIPTRRDFQAMQKKKNAAAGSQEEKKKGPTIKFEPPPDDQVMYTTYRYVDSLGNTVNPGTEVQNYVYYANNLAHALFTQHEFDIGSSPIDVYTQHADSFYLATRVPPQKMAGYLRCIGQEVPLSGYSTALGNVTQNSEAREQIFVLNGPQTPKPTQPDLKLIYPYKFDMCEAPSASIPVLQCPGLLRQIRSHISQPQRCIFTQAPIFLETTKYIWTADTDDNIVTSQSWVSRERLILPDSAVDTTSFFDSACLYINNIFIDQSIHSILINRSLYSLTRVHMSFGTTISGLSGMYQLSGIKWALEYMFFGMRSASQEDPSTPGFPVMWDQFIGYTERIYQDYYNAQMTTGLNGAWNSCTNTTDYVYYQRFPIMTAAQFILQNTQYVEDQEGLPAVFYDSYVPYRAYGSFISTPSQSGVCMLNFSFHPGGRAPYGYYNVSNSKEFYIQPVCPLVPQQIMLANLYAEGIALNMLLIAQGQCTMQFN